jgi:DMSO reductase anchor subunit
MMLKLPGALVQNSATQLPDPARPGPYRPFASDPGWREAWWWLAVPVVSALALLAVYRLSPAWYDQHVLPEGYGVLEFTQFVVMLVALAIAVRLLFNPFVRRRPFVLTVTILSALACLYIAGEEMSWGQHFFHWNTPDYWALVNRQSETNLHNTYAIFEKWPRAILQTGVLIGGLLVPLAAVFDPRVRANRLSLFLPPAALVPAAIAVFAFKFLDIAQQKGYLHTLVQRPSEAVEFYLYFFIFAYLVIFERRIREIEREGRGKTPRA